MYSCPHTRHEGVPDCGTAYSFTQTFSPSQMWWVISFKPRPLYSWTIVWGASGLVWTLRTREYPIASARNRTPITRFRIRNVVT